MSEDIVEISSSKLGTKEFWTDRYEMELHNFEACGDEGELWFGRSAENRIIKYLLNSKACKDSAILDLGCGNGSVLRRLRTNGFSNLCGVDYCAAAIDLSEKTMLAEDGQSQQALPNITWKVLDILDPDKNFLHQQYDIVLDKGTWDAMSLSDDRDSRLIAYKKTVMSALRTNGQFLIISCNFTKEELQTFFCGDGMSFLCDIPAVSSFSFGGKVGVTSTGIVFKR